MAQAHHISGLLQGVVIEFGPDAYSIPSGYREIFRTKDMPESDIWASDDMIYLCDLPPVGFERQIEEAMAAYTKGFQVSGSSDR